MENYIKQRNAINKSLENNYNQNLQEKLLKTLLITMRDLMNLLITNYCIVELKNIKV